WLEEIDVSCAFARSVLAPGCRNVLMMARPLSVTDSVCSILLTTGVMLRSIWDVMRPSISSAFIPVYVQMEARTGISMFGKTSVGVREMTSGLIPKINSANTINVYGRE